MKVQLLTEKLSEDDKVGVLISSNIRGAAHCNNCLTRIVNVKLAVYENSTMFCSRDCARDYRTSIVTKKGIFVNND